MKNLFLFLFLFCSFLSFGQWSTTNLSQAKVQMGAVAYGSKAYFGGGISGSLVVKSVEIYESSTGNWSSTQLSVARSFPAAVASDGQVFFAGGINWNGLIHYSTVDIFDTLTQQWSLAELSSGRMYIQAANVGNKVLFAGGYKVLSFSPLPNFEFTNVVDVYDINIKSWNTQTLSEARAGMAVAVVGDLAIFAGGQNGNLTVSDRVDIFNAQTGAWSTSTLSEARAFCTATSVGGKVLIAGGVTNNNLQSDRVDIFDPTTGSWTTASLSEGRAFTTMSASACGKAFIAAGGRLDLQAYSFTDASSVVDVYDPVTDVWTTDYLQKSVINHSVIGLQDHILVAGGLDPTNSLLFKTVEIFSCEETNTLNPGAFENGWLQVSPNPATDIINLDFENFSIETLTVSIHNAAGRVMFVENTSARTIDIRNLPEGLYFVIIKSDTRTGAAKIFKI